MASEAADGLKVAILVTDGFEQVEMTALRKALDATGAEARLVSSTDGQVTAWTFGGRGDAAPADRSLAGLRWLDFDALLLPGGVINPDKLRLLPQAVALAKAFFNAGTHVSSMWCGPWTISEPSTERARPRQAAAE